MRLIDADVLLDNLDQIRTSCMTVYGNLAGAVSGVMKTIDTFPAVDAVPVVRCGGCKYGRKCGDEISCYHPEYASREGVWSYEEDFYCKYGEPKEGNGNG